MSGNDDFLSRWSSRKRAVTEEEAAEARAESDAPADPAAVPSDATESKAGESEEEILARFNLPSPESLGPGDDYSGFMQSGVPEFLRRRALRRLWRSNPVLANLDGLNDYDEDFTSPEETMKVLKTAYQVGRGFLTDPTEDTRENADNVVDGAAETEDATIGASDTDDAQEAPDAMLVAHSEPETGGEIAPPHRQPDNSPEDQDAPAPRPRRMRFET